MRRTYLRARSMLRPRRDASRAVAAYVGQVAGFVAALYGIAQVSPPAAWLIGGVTLMLASYGLFGESSE